MLNQFSAIK